MSVKMLAVTARSGSVVYTQPDGEKITVTLHGDEHVHWYESESGQLLQPQADGRLIPADPEFMAALSARRAAPRRTSSYTSFPTTGHRKALVILVEFSDRQFTYGLDEFRAMITQPDYSKYGGAGSARDYFIENSCGQFVPEFDVYGPVRLSNPIAWYGGDNDARAHEMVAEACVALDGEVDFSLYDCDGDGWVDNVYVFYAGYGEADGGGANTIWPHSANVYNKGGRVFLDNVHVGRYACSNELIGNSTRMVGIGTFCHEFSHVLGLPDLYPTNGEDIATPYYWSLMEHGNYNDNGRRPCAMTAYERIFLGWGTPIVASGSATLRIPPISSNIFYRIDVPGNPEEYFLLENRQREDWDASLPGHGLLVWHIDYDRSVWDSNGVNNDPARQRVAIVAANGNPAMAGSGGHTYPGVAGVTSLENLKPNTGTTLSHKILSIREEGDALLLDFNSSSAVPAKPAGLKADDIDDTFFTLSWAGASDVDKSLLSLYTCENGRLRIEPGYNLLPLESFPHKVDNLDPETDYRLRLYPVHGITVGEPSDELLVTTAAPGIGFMKPVALPAEDLGDVSFTARWEKLAQAERYLLSVWRMDRYDVDADVARFSVPMSLPDGWSSNVGTTMSVAGYYGESAPSLRMQNNADMLQTAVYDKPVETFRFWMRGYKAPAGSSLAVEALAGGNWVKVDEITGIDNSAGKIYDFSAKLPAGTTSLRIAYRTAAATGSVCIDDVTVGFGQAEKREYVLEDFDCGDTDRHTVNGLTPATCYYYSIVAAKAERRSLPSDEVSLFTGTSSIINLNPAGNEAAYYTIDCICLGSSAGSYRGVVIAVKNGRAEKVVIR